MRLIDADALIEQEESFYCGGINHYDSEDPNVCKSRYLIARLKEARVVTIDDIAGYVIDAQKDELFGESLKEEVYG